MSLIVYDKFKRYVPLVTLSVTTGALLSSIAFPRITDMKFAEKGIGKVFVFVLFAVVVVFVISALSVLSFWAIEKYLPFFREQKSPAASPRATYDSDGDLDDVWGSSLHHSDSESPWPDVAESLSSSAAKPSKGWGIDDSELPKGGAWGLD